MNEKYSYKYAILRNTGLCTTTQDTTDFILRPTYVPISDVTLPYLMKYYYPIPETATSFDNFQGKWYYDAEHTSEIDELNNQNI